MTTLVIIPNKSNFAGFFVDCLSVKIWSWQFGTFYIAWHLIFEPVITCRMLSVCQCNIF